MSRSKARLRNREIVFSKTARALVDEYLAEEVERVRRKVVTEAVSPKAATTCSGRC
jgi:hypothetical protein